MRLDGSTTSLAVAWMPTVTIQTARQENASRDRGIEVRLTEACTEAQSSEFDVSANVYSQSGEKFLFDVASSVEIGLSTLKLTALRVSAVGCNPRW